MLYEVQKLHEFRKLRIFLLLLRTTTAELLCELLSEPGDVSAAEVRNICR